MSIPVPDARRRAPLWASIAAFIVSQVGNNLSYIVIPWFVLEITGSPALMGVTAATGIIPVALVGFFGGALVDRVGYKRMSVVSDIASAIAVALVPLLHLTIGLAFWQLLVLVFLGAVLDSPGNTARVSLYPDLARLAGMRLERANSILAVSRRAAALIGAPIGGLLVVWVGASQVLWINAASFLVSAGLTALLVPSLSAARAEQQRASYIGDMVEGLRYIRGDRLILWIIVVMSVGGFLAEPLYTVVMPNYAREVYGSAMDLGLMYGSLAAGSIVGGVLYGLFGYRFPRHMTSLLGFSVRAATFWVLVAMPSIWVVMLAIVVNSIMLEPVNPMVMTIFQERIPDHMRGRVFGAATSLGIAAMPLGMVGYGFLISAIGLESTLWVLASVNLLVPALIAVVPAFRHMESNDAPVSAVRNRPLAV